MRFLGDWRATSIIFVNLTNNDRKTGMERKRTNTYECKRLEIVVNERN